MFDYFKPNGELTLGLIDGVRDTINWYKDRNNGSATPSVFYDASEYILGYARKPHYPVPALADSETVLALNHFGTMAGEALFAWDGIWREPIKVCYRLFDY